MQIVGFPMRRLNYEDILIRDIVKQALAESSCANNHAKQIFGSVKVIRKLSWIQSFVPFGMYCYAGSLSIWCN